MEEEEELGIEENKNEKPALVEQWREETVEEHSQDNFENNSEEESDEDQDSMPHYTTVGKRVQSNTYEGKVDPYSASTISRQYRQVEETTLYYTEDKLKLKL